MSIEKTMITCYRVGNKKDGVVVDTKGDLIEITTDFACIASRLLAMGIPIEVLVRCVTVGDKHKMEWEHDKS